MARGIGAGSLSRLRLAGLAAGRPAGSRGWPDLRRTTSGSSASAESSTSTTCCSKCSRRRVRHRLRRHAPVALPAPSRRRGAGPQPGTTPLIELLVPGATTCSSSATPHRRCTGSTAPTRRCSSTSRPFPRRRGRPAPGQSSLHATDRRAGAHVLHAGGQPTEIRSSRDDGPAVTLSVGVDETAEAHAVANASLAAIRI